MFRCSDIDEYLLICVFRCTDIDECSENTDGCEEVCENTGGGFKCLCQKGLRLDSDQRSCVGEFCFQNIHFDVLK